MIDPKSLFDTFSRHVASCRSAPFVLNARASFEQWFVVELYPALIDLGYRPDQIERTYLYPDNGKRGDLALRSLAGYGAGAVAPLVFGWVLDVQGGAEGWGWAFGTLAAAGALAVVATAILHRLPEARALTVGTAKS